MNKNIRSALESQTGIRVLVAANALLLIVGLSMVGPTGSKPSGSPLAAPSNVTNPAPTGTGTASTGPTSGATGTKAPSGIVSPTGGDKGGIRFKDVKPSVPASSVPDFGLITQGITNKQVKVGMSYNVADCGDAAALNAAYANAAGDPKKAITAFTKHINSTGGIQGLEFKPVIVDDGGSGCPEKNVAAAVQMLEQDKVFFAMPGLHVESDYLIQRHLPVFGGRDDPASLARYGANGLQLLEPEEPTYEAWATFARYQLKSAEHKPCLIRIEKGAAGDFDTSEKILKQQMTKQGLSFGDRIYVFKDDVSTAQQQSDDIVTSAQSKGCDQVFFMAGNPIGLIFMTDAAFQHGWMPTWTFTSRTYGIDDDTISSLMNKAEWNNAIGLSYRVPSGKHPKEGNCKKIYEKYYPNDGLSTSAAVNIVCAQFLTGTEMMRRAIKLTGTLNANTLMLGASEIQGDFFYDATVPMDFNIRKASGPFKTRGFSYYTIADYDSSQNKYTFPKYPCYYRTFKANDGGCENLEGTFKNAQ
ncbi:MAG: ABC transporter substrate-binding protein [Actinomycetota bacterium]